MYQPLLQPGYPVMSYLQGNGNLPGREKANPLSPVNFREEFSNDNCESVLWKKFRWPVTCCIKHSTKLQLLHVKQGDD